MVSIFGTSISFLPLVERSSRPADLEIDMAQKVTKESNRPKLSFLASQAKLLS